MNQPEKMTQEKSYMEMAIDIAIRIGVLALLIAWCFQILRPFITIVIWGAIIAISFYPMGFYHDSAVASSQDPLPWYRGRFRVYSARLRAW